MKPKSGFLELDQDTIKFRLAEILRNRQPKSSQLFNLHQYHLQGILHKIDCPAKFFWYTGLDPEQTCIVGRLANRFHNEIQWIILAPLTHPREAMVALSDLIDWDKNTTFNAVDVIILPFLKEQCEAHGGTGFCGPGLVQDMRLEQALELIISNEELKNGRIQLRPLNEDEAPIVLKHWKFAGHNDGEAVRQSIRNIPSGALLFDGKLVSWGFASIDGAIHAVHTLEEYRRQGLGQILLKYLCRSLAEAGLVPLVQIESDNDVSKRTMERVGFQYSHDMSWTIFEANSAENK